MPRFIVYAVGTQHVWTAITAADLASAERLAHASIHTPDGPELVWELDGPLADMHLEPQEAIENDED